MSHVGVFASIRPEHMAIDMFLCVCHHDDAIANLKTCCTRVPSYDSQQRAGEVTLLPKHKLRFFLESALNICDPGPGGLCRCLLNRITRTQMIFHETDKRAAGYRGTFAATGRTSGTVRYRGHQHVLTTRKQVNL